MKKNKLLVLSLLASTLLVGCEEGTFVTKGSEALGGVGVVDQSGNAVSGEKLETTLKVQDLYENLKEASGGAKAVEKLIEMLAQAEYGYNAENGTINISANAEALDVRKYHDSSVNDSFKADIAEFFENIIDGTSYLDDDGKFDKEAYKEYLEETLDYEFEEGSSKYISEAYLGAELFETVSELTFSYDNVSYNFDKYIEEVVIADILESYIYLDYVASSSKYEPNFRNQYAIEFEVLKIKHDTTKINGAWNEALIRDVKAVVGNTDLSTHTFGTDYSFVTFDSDDNMILFTTTASALTYNVYDNTDAIDALIDTMYTPVLGGSITQLKHNDAAVTAAAVTANAEKSFTIDANSVANEEFYSQVEQILIARDLWAIDREVVLARNYDWKTPYYEAMIESEKTAAKGYADTYSNNNAKPIKEVVKSKKITAAQAEYHTEKEVYTKANYSTVLPSALTSLRGTSAQTLQNNLVEFGAGNKFLLPNKDGLNDPVYLDTSSSNYYICEVYNWYGYYQDGKEYGVSSVSKSDYHIDAYKEGQLIEYKYDEESDTLKAQEPIAYNGTQKDYFEEKVTNMVQTTAKAILTDAIKTEAIVSLFEKYGLEVNDQDVYDYMASTYPDYFEDEEEEKKD